MRHISDEEALDLFKQLRLEAIEHVHHRIPIYSLALEQDEKYALAKKWEAAGWIVRASLQAGPSMLGNYQLAEQYLGYAPGDERIMSPEEKARYVVAAQKATSSAGAIVISEFVKFAPKEALYKLILAGIVTKKGVDTRRQHVLANEYKAPKKCG